MDSSQHSNRYGGWQNANSHLQHVTLGCVEIHNPPHSYRYMKSVGDKEQVDHVAMGKAKVRWMAGTSYQNTTHHDCTQNSLSI